MKRRAAAGRWPGANFAAVTNDDALAGRTAEPRSGDGGVGTRELFEGLPGAGRVQPSPVGSAEERAHVRARARKEAVEAAPPLGESPGEGGARGMAMHMAGRPAKRGGKPQ